ncbi:MAG: hypothetical protein Salg2KO_13310 [Salibacteraceae bacterium]
MKRSVLFGVIALFSLSAKTQTTTEGFESLALESDTFRNGSDMSAGFDFQPFMLPNQYDTAFGGSWSGFAMSTMRNDSTSGFSNQYSAITGSGYNSDIYAVGYPPFSGDLEVEINPLLDQSIRLETMRVTNSAYAYFSMRDGDAFAKQFGGESGNDPDYFNLHTVLVIDNTPIDTVTYPLADFTFQNNAMDYIVDSWEEVDLTGFDTAITDTSALRFYFTSSDTAFGFINTPTYFCLDDLEYSLLLGLAKMNDSMNEFSVTHIKNGIHINTHVNASMEVYTIAGQLITQKQLPIGDHHYSFENLVSGWHLIKIDGQHHTETLKAFKH